jgi:hypothetical protein
VFTEWFDEHENDVNHMPWLPESPYLNPIEHLWGILEQRLRLFSTTINKTQNDGLMDEWCIIKSKLYLSHAPNTTDVDLKVKCLHTSPSTMQFQ